MILAFTDGVIRDGSECLVTVINCKQMSYTRITGEKDVILFII